MLLSSTSELFSRVLSFVIVRTGFGAGLEPDGKDIRFESNLGGDVEGEFDDLYFSIRPKSDAIGASDTD